MSWLVTPHRGQELCGKEGSTWAISGRGTEKDEMQFILQELTIQSVKQDGLYEPIRIQDRLVNNEEQNI